MKIISLNYDVPKIATATESLEILHFEQVVGAAEDSVLNPFTKA